DAALRRGVSIRPEPSCGADAETRRWADGGTGRGREGEREGGSERQKNISTPQHPNTSTPQHPTPDPKLTSADVAEALHRATGLPIIADYYTRLYTPSEVLVEPMPLFDALNRLADAMHLRWTR